MSGNVLYHFSDSTVQPYVIGGIGVLSSRSVFSVTTVSRDQATITELASTDHGLAISWGGGLKLFVKPRISVRPEIRFYDSSVRSRANLSLFRASVALAYHW